jgi:type 1 glutamine amidotransferase
VDVSDPLHPLTRGLESFETVDEQYLSVPRADIHMLLETHFAGEATGFVDNLHWVDDRPQPVLYLRKFGKGEILYLTLGHCRGHYDLQPLADFNPIIERGSWSQPIFYELLRRGIGWAQP